MRFFEQQRQARAQTFRLLLLFALTLLVLVVAVNAALALTWRLVAWQDAAYPAYFFYVNTGMTLLFVLGGWWIESSNLAGGGEQLARRVGARPAKVLGPLSRLGSEDTEQKFCNIVSELAIAASMKAPTPMVLDRVDSINAFACGWGNGEGDDDAVVAVTQGALNYLTRDELQGLVAHEFSHIREGDMQLNMRLAGMVSGLEMIFNLGNTMCDPGDDGSRSFLALPGFAIKGVGSLGWLAGRVLKASVSRQREYLADARAVQFTRSKDGLGGVLRKALGQGDVARPLHPSVQHMLLLGPDQASWLATHPPIAERIRRIYGHTMGALDSNESPQTRPDQIS
ncbi:MAG: M48 family metalloprotease [Polaromonas sp.]|nr:M48 family metalloprotease [Polaromonas sp.]